jgi:hypothetical protein
MPKEWTDDEVRQEIADAIAIVREDRFEAFVRSRTASNANSDNPGTPPGNPGNNPGSNNPTPKKKGLFWGIEE